MCSHDRLHQVGVHEDDACVSHWCKGFSALDKLASGRIQAARHMGCNIDRGKSHIENIGGYLVLLKKGFEVCALNELHFVALRHITRETMGAEKRGGRGFRSQIAATMFHGISGELPAHGPIL